MLPPKKLIIMAASALAGLAGCGHNPLVEWSSDTPPMALVPATYAGVKDGRARFREIFCAVLEKHGADLPDYRPCAEALTRVGVEPAGEGNAVGLEPSTANLLAGVVPGLGWECFEGWLDSEDSVQAHIEQQGFRAFVFEVDGLSGVQANARQIRDAIIALPDEDLDQPLVLIGYSKGAPDILEAVVAYPELHDRVAAVVSASGAIGGSPLAIAAEQEDLGILKHIPRSKCADGDGGAIDSMRPATRNTWLANHVLPSQIKYYSLVTLPAPERISSIMNGTYKQLAQIDPRNDGQLLFYDQVIPGSTLLGYVNADHWALAVPIARSHAVIGATLVDQNDYPREALLEAILRYVEEDLENSR